MATESYVCYLDFQRIPTFIIDRHPFDMFGMAVIFKVVKLVVVKNTLCFECLVEYAYRSIATMFMAWDELMLEVKKISHLLPFVLRVILTLCILFLSHGGNSYYLQYSVLS